jgi:threonylcarbamoyladenosine tRNA methylthiotransferase MtaB
MPTFSLCCMGCRLNQYETEVISGRLEALGLRAVPFGTTADITVVNTCTVTARADADARNLIRRARRASPAGKVIVTGCYAQAQPEAVEALGTVDLQLDNREKDRLVQRAVEAFGHLFRAANPVRHLAFELDGFSRHTRAMVKIQDGCHEACTYCIIPRARGAERSRPPHEIRAEVRRLEVNGYKEVVLTGVHVGKYRWEDQRLAGLLRLILRTTDVPQIRLTSMEPREFHDDLLELLREKPRLCPHLHVPVQSGHDAVLGAMHRNYNTAWVSSLFERLAAARPELAIGTDVIAGFPGETDAQFEQSCDFIASLPLAYLHVFSYSDRPGTEASRMPGKIRSEVIKQRTHRLRALSRQLRRRFLRRYLGQIIPVLIERRRDRRTGWLVGMSGNYMRVLAQGPDALMNQIVPLRMIRLEDEQMVAEAA